MYELNLHPHDKSCKLVHEKCHWTSYHNVITYCMTEFSNNPKLWHFILKSLSTIFLKTVLESNSLKDHLKMELTIQVYEV